MSDETFDAGHLAELNGKFKMRATEVVFAPGADLGVHHHVGPGIRYVVSGTLTVIPPRAR
jgi:quercetin dioxygenase-like cupin family protein